VSAASLARTLRDYVSLTKPRVVSLLLWTTLCSMVAAKGEDLEASIVLWTLLGGYLAAGGAGAINHYIERDRDARMSRTAGRPIATGRVPAARGLAFGIALGAIAAAELAIAVNLLAAGLAMAGLTGYVFVYTVWLKPRTPQNIVIGGAAGAIPPLVGWAAATGEVGLPAVFMFGVVFLWTPPHFWALSLLIREDYERTGVPMMPVVRGEPATRNSILGYALVLWAFTLLPALTGFFGAVYLAAAALAGAGLVALAIHLRRAGDRGAAFHLYLSSLAYLAIVFAAMAVDRV
jgi:protoheme IX farnesyltransferase